MYQSEEAALNRRSGLQHKKNHQRLGCAAASSTHATSKGYNQSKAHSKAEPLPKTKPRQRTGAEGTREGAGKS